MVKALSEMEVKKTVQQVTEVYGFTKGYMRLFTNKPYHNFKHAEDVTCTAINLALKEELPEEKMPLIITSALIHDLEQHDICDEERSILLGYKVLPGIGYSENDLDEIANAVRATKPSEEPTTLMGKILKDADCANIGRNDFFEKSELVRRELGFEKDKQWYTTLVEMLKQHKWYTNAAKKQYEIKKQENIQQVEIILQQYQE